jgi:N-carbamoylputrescine amidase
MRVTVCELPHDPEALAAAWAALCEHTVRHSSELVLLPELAMVDPLWQDELFDASRWEAAQASGELWCHRLPELGVARVVGTRPVTIDGRRLNQGFLWSASGGLAPSLVPLRSKFYLPDEPGSWEARWFDRGDPDFTEYHAGTLSFALNICTELWAVETYAAYAAHGVQAILSPRATAAATTAKWLSAGLVAAVRSAAFSLSSNRVEPMGACGGVGWIINPYGQILAVTNHDAPFATVDIDLSASEAAHDEYPCYVLSGRRR